MSLEDLVVAVRQRTFNLAKAELEKGVNPNSQRSDQGYPLAWAVHNSDINMTKLLLLYGASVTHDKSVRYNDIEVYIPANQPEILALIKFFKSEYDVAMYLLAAEYADSAATDARTRDKAIAIMKEYALRIVSANDKAEAKEGPTEKKLHALVHLYTSPYINNPANNDEKVAQHLSRMSNPPQELVAKLSPANRELRQQLLARKQAIMAMDYPEGARAIYADEKRVDLAYQFLQSDNLTFQILAERIVNSSEERKEVRENKFAEGLSYLFGIKSDLFNINLANKSRANGAFLAAADLGLPEASFWYAVGLIDVHKNDLEAHLPKIVKYFEKAHQESTKPGLRIEVIKQLEALLGKFPKNKLICIALGNCYQRDAAQSSIPLLRKAKNVFETIADGAEHYQAYASVCFHLGVLLDKEGKSREALTCYQIAHDKGYLPATTNLAELLSSGRLTEEKGGGEFYDRPKSIELYTIVIKDGVDIFNDPETKADQKEKAYRNIKEAHDALNVLIFSVNNKEEEQIKTTLKLAQPVFFKKLFHDWLLVKDQSKEVRDGKIAELHKFADQLDPQDPLKEKAEFYVGLTIAHRQSQKRLGVAPKLLKEYEGAYAKLMQKVKTLSEKSRQGDCEALQQLSSYNYYIGKHNRAFFYALVAMLLTQNQIAKLEDYSNPGIKTDPKLHEAGSEINGRLTEYLIIFDNIKTEMSVDSFDELVRDLLQLEKYLVYEKKLKNSRIKAAVAKDEIRVDAGKAGEEKVENPSVFAKFAGLFFSRKSLGPEQAPPPYVVTTYVEGEAPAAAVPVVDLPPPSYYSPSVSLNSANARRPVSAAAAGGLFPAKAAGAPASKAPAAAVQASVVSDVGNGKVKPSAPPPPIVMI